MMCRSIGTTGVFAIMRMEEDTHSITVSVSHHLVGTTMSDHLVRSALSDRLVRSAMSDHLVGSEGLAFSEPGEVVGR
jgi:hypothetical protein